MKLKRILAIILVLVIAASTVAVFVACNKKDGDSQDIVIIDDDDDRIVDKIEQLDPDDGVKHKKAIIYVTALFGGGLYNEKTNEAVWDPFRADYDLYDHWAPSENTIYKFAEILLEYAKEMDSAAMTIVKAMSYRPGTLLYDLSLDQDGNGLNPDVVPANYKPRYKNNLRMHCYYGAIGIYQNFMINARKTFGDEYDCYMFNQDWRKSPGDSGKALEEFINENGWEEVVLMSHSMGGPVVNSYLARSQENRDKVKLYMAFAPATLGSFDAFGAMTCPSDYLGSFLTTFGFDFDYIFQGTSVISYFGKGYIEILLKRIEDFFNNNVGMMALCPSYEFLSSPQCSGESVGGLWVDGYRYGQPTDPDDPASVETAKQELYDFYNTLQWAIYYDIEDVLDENGKPVKDEKGFEQKIYHLIHYTDGETLEDGSVVRIVNGEDIKKGLVEVANFNAVKDVLVNCDSICYEKGGVLTVQTDVNGNPICVNKNGDRIKYGAARLRTYYEGLYVDGDIAMSKVNSYYFVGLDIKSTITGIRMTTKSVDENGYKQYSCTVVHDDVAKAGEEGWIGGDGMVCYYASLAGEDIEALRESGHLIEFPNFWHADVGGAWPILGEYVYKYIGELVAEE